MKIVIKNRLNQAEPLVLTHMTAQLPDLILSLAMMPEENRSKFVSFFANKVKHIPKAPPTLEDISKLLCGAVQPTDWHLSHIAGRRISIDLKGSSAYWHTLEIDETSYFKHRVENSQLLEHIIHQHAKPMQIKITPPAPETPPLGMRSPIEVAPLKLEARVNRMLPYKRNILFSGLIGMTAGIILFFLKSTNIAIMAAMSISSLLTFLISHQLQKNKPPIRILSPSSPPQVLTPSPTPVLPPKKPIGANQNFSVNPEPFSEVTVKVELPQVSQKNRA